jgi:hypothetical protein
MPEKKSNQKLNPEVTSISVGVRYLRKVKFYPLSAAHQLEMTDIIETVFKELVGVTQGEDNEESLIVFFQRVLEIVKENIETIIAMICDEDSADLLADLTNLQLVEVITYVYTTNFEAPLKNLLNLFQKEGDEKDWKELVLNQLSPQSVKSTDTDLKTSTEKDTEKEESLSVN